MSVNTAFQPSQGTNQNLSASATSQIATIDRNGANQVRITVKAGGGDLYVYTYSSSDPTGVRAAGVNDFCIVAGQSSTFTRALRHDRVAYVTDAGATANFKMCLGEGM